MRENEKQRIAITNDFMFCKVMEQQDICRDVLQAILPELSIGRLEYLEKQKTIDFNFHSRGIRLDVFSKDEQRVYDIEMQCLSVDDLAKRSRYYQSLIDTELLKKSEDYRKLRESYVIFICTFDLFQKDQIIYHFENICKEDSKLSLRDGAYKIFINTKGTKGRISEGLKALIDYFENRRVKKNDLIERIDKAVDGANNDQKWREAMGTLEMRFRDYEEIGRKAGLKEGEVIGSQKKLLQIAKKMLTAGNSIESVMELTELSKEEILNLSHHKQP